MSSGSPRPPPRFGQALLAGAAAGTSVDLLFFPIDTLKTRLQSAQGFWRAGGLGGVYRGVGSVVVGSAPGAAAFFTTYEYLKRTLSLLPPLSDDSAAPARHILAASLGEIAACLVRVPTEVVKSAAQTGAYAHPELGLGGAVGSLASARSLWRSEGVRGFYKGFGITVAREIPFTSIQFPLYEYLKLQIQRYTGRRPYWGEAALCGSLAGGVAAALTTPLDVAKTRVMLELRTSSSSPNRQPSIYARLLSIQATEGTRALFAGVVPRTLWISAGGAVFLGVYEWVVEAQMALG
ncbi:mitochondrial carrier [Calocera viscosa TUFC12733]|uniref:Mitochondrial carrier n=1 Tax=Calocera viscosa (strain TUFC12733) TaxID=1330018 RepID=A0A167IHD8_CALVF|nr:mitochondrial carrier [Calocera viscosa TUFC12733]